MFLNNVHFGESEQGEKHAVLICVASADLCCVELRIYNYMGQPKHDLLIVSKRDNLL